MNILINFVALHGGGSLYSFEMAKAMRDNGHNVYAIISTKMETFKDWQAEEGINIIEITGYSNKINFVFNLAKFLFFEKNKIKKIRKEVKFDLVYIPIITYWTIFVQRYLKGIRTVYTAHDVVPHDNKNRSFTNICQTKIGRNSDDIIILSKCYLDEACTRFLKAKKNVYVLPHPNCFKHESHKMASKRYPASFFNFIFYGQITEYKGLDILAKAFKYVFEKRKDVSLMVAGSGDISPYIEEFRKIGCNRITIINRWIGDEEIPELFSALKQITVLPYKNATQSGVIPLSMHLKTPILATKCSGINEQIVDEETGFLVEPNDYVAFGDKMLYLIDNWDVAVKASEKAYDYIESMSWKNVINIYLDAIIEGNN